MPGRAEYDGQDPNSGYDQELTRFQQGLVTWEQFREQLGVSDVSQDRAQTWNEANQVWAESRDQRAREQQAIQRAEIERLQQQLQVAVEESREDERKRIEAEMNRLAAQQSRRYKNVQRRDEAAARAQEMMRNPYTRAALEQQGYRATAWQIQPLAEGTPPTAVTWEKYRAQLSEPEASKADPLGQGVPPFEDALLLTQAAQTRRDLITRSLTDPVRQPAQTAEQARMELGKALQVAVDSGLISEQQGLLMMAAGGLNADPMSQAETRQMLYDVLAQATRSKQLGLGRARTIARLIQDAPVGVNEPPGEVPIPEPDEPPTLDALRSLALRSVPLGGWPLTPVGLDQAGPELQLLARELPGVVERLQALEDLIYDALLVQPCHAGHELHLQTPFLCDDQKSSMLLDLLAGLGINARELPRDAHRDPNGERASCCQKDGRVGTWLVYGQYINPDLRMRGEQRPQVRRGKARPEILDDIAETEGGS